jgi:hypothetical protein
VTDPLPHNLLGRIIVRVLALEWFAGQVLLLTLAAIVLAAVGRWRFAVFIGAVALAGWVYIVRDEFDTRGELPRS